MESDAEDPPPHQPSSDYGPASGGGYGFSRWNFGFRIGFHMRDGIDKVGHKVFLIECPPPHGGGYGGYGLSS